MTVSADDLALLDLGEQLVPRLRDELVADVELLIAEVIELQDQGIGFATVSAWMILEELNEKAEPIRAHLPFTPASANDVVGLVRLVVLTASSGAAGLAVAPEPALLPVLPREVRRWLFFSAPRASPA